MRWLAAVLLLLMSSVLGTTLAAQVPPRELRPDLFFVFAVIAAATVPSERALVWVWAAGLAKDIFSVGPVGLHALLFLGAGLVVLRVRSYAYIEAPLAMFLLTGALAGGCEFIYATALFVQQPQVVLGSALARTLLQAFATGLMAALVWRLAEKRLRHLGWRGRVRLR